MMVHESQVNTSVPGPDGKQITLKDLPDAAVRGGLLSLKEACERYNLSEEEFSCWEALYDRHGSKGLRVTRVQQYRN